MADVLRYYLTTILPENKDSEFTWKGFQDANNSELVAIFGNFVNRSFVLMHKLCNGKVPPLHATRLDAKDEQLIKDIEDAKIKIEQAIEHYKFREALFEVIDLARKGNRYMQEKEPWILAKSLESNPLNQQLIDNCLHLCLQLTANLAIFIHPFLPHTAKTLCHMMKVVDKMLEWKNGGRIKLLSVGYSLRAPELLFRKIEDSEIATQLDKLKAGARAAEEAKAKTAALLAGGKPDAAPEKADQDSPKAEIQFDDFAKIDLRVGTIKSAERIPKADKLLKLEVDMGSEVRTICSGIAAYFSPEAIIGKQVTVVANLAPRKMRGIVSNGMILMSEDQNGQLVFVNPDQAVPNGKTVN
jgi:methionyl-tRNA synthetase